MVYLKALSVVQNIMYRMAGREADNVFRYVKVTSHCNQIGNGTCNAIMTLN